MNNIPCQLQVRVSLPEFAKKTSQRLLSTMKKNTRNVTFQKITVRLRSSHHIPSPQSLRHGVSPITLHSCYSEPLRRNSHTVAFTAIHGPIKDCSLKKDTPTITTKEPGFNQRNLHKDIFCFFCILIKSKFAKQIS